MVRRRQYCVYICYVCSMIRNYHTYLKIHIWITLNIHKCDTLINVEHLKASGQYCTQARLKSSNYGIFRMNGAWELKSNIFSKRLPMDCWLWCSIPPLDLVGLLVVDTAVVPIHQGETMSPTPRWLWLNHSCKCSACQISTIMVWWYYWHALCLTWLYNPTWQC